MSSQELTDSRPTLRRMLVVMRFAATLVFRAARRELAWMIGLQLVSSVALGAQVLLARQLFVSLLAHSARGPARRFS